ncbi:MAG TPA: CPBP family intramembrane glutamic endopeptidase [Candidatus Binatia bacterium]|nr:CPBP family intramembrane glutamic endopeptidase [Candidatus Binatia bacterium]
MEAPTVTVRAERGFVVTAAQARNYRAGAIFLDGAAQGGPFVEVQKELYNLDHHEGCIRPFTLATCEQAMVLIRRMVDLRKRDWTVFANDADLDTVFALWVILNHFRINDDAAVRFRLMPLLRLEGAIDAHGLELQEMVALSPDLFDATSTTLKQLLIREAALKSEGTWYKVDLLEYIAERLQTIDGLIYSPKHFDGLHEVEELARVEIVNGSVALACRSDAGIYELEQQLRKLHGDRLGILILQTEPSTYTLRQVNQMLPATLDQAYQRLNLIDPAVGGGSRNRWGGSVEIGGSPRGTGTRLTPIQITETVREAFRRPTLVDILHGIGRGVLLGVAGMLPLGMIFPHFSLQNRAAEEILPIAVILSLMSGVLFLSKVRQAPGLYGWRPPTGLDWLTMLPAALIGAAAGGIWIPGSHQGLNSLNELTAYAFLLLPVTVEIVFRGLILGDLAWRLPIERSGGPWFVSWPAFISGVLYASMFLSFLIFTSDQIKISHWFVTLPAAVMFGTALGMARERSESIVAPILLHWLCAAALLLVRNFLL